MYPPPAIVWLNDSTDPIVLWHRNIAFVHAGGSTLIALPGSMLDILYGEVAIISRITNDIRYDLPLVSTGTFGFQRSLHR